MAERKLFRKAFITTMIQKGVEIRTTDTAVTHSQQIFAGPWRGDRNILDFGSARGSTQSSKGFHSRNIILIAFLSRSPERVSQPWRDRSARRKPAILWFFLLLPAW